MLIIMNLALARAFFSVQTELRHRPVHRAPACPPVCEAHACVFVLCPCMRACMWWTPAGGAQQIKDDSGVYR